ncbi:MAG: hypothetical protein NUV91_03835, partial [Candidatus Omnitrophica bacterium]|nr:hypothetical protein [Candidatus Omnitrophota bacterium]
NISVTVHSKKKGEVLMKKVLAMVGVAAILCFVGANAVFAQGTSAATSAVENKGMIAFGTISKIEKDQIVLLEYNEETDAEEEKIYSVSDKTQFSDQLTLEDLLVGDPIEISYVDEGGKKVAQNIKLEDTFLEGDEWEELGEQGLPTEEESNLEKVSP